MNLPQPTRALLLGGILAAVAPLAGAHSLDATGSLLLFPIFDNTRGGVFVLTVTNTNSDLTPAGTLMAGTTDVEFVYINQANCQEFNRTRRLTPNDTLSVVTLLDNPNMTRGYVYVFAKNPTTGRAVKFDWLAGESFAVTPTPLAEGSNTSFGLSLDPIVFKAGAALAPGAQTDLDSDNIRDLNGLEYAQAPDKLFVPRFIASPTSELILIGLTGGSYFTTIIDLLVFNDNEEVFSAQHTFSCWQRVRLVDINGLFSNSFLQTTNHAAGESVLGLETGWFRIDGNIAYSTAVAFQDPAVLAVRIDRPTSSSGFASLPYALGLQANGDLVPRGVMGDSN